MAKFNDVLLVEDDPITIMVCDRIIKMNDFAERVVSCENGRIALDHLLQLRESQNLPEIIFLDINMPIMNGWDFLDEFDFRKKDFSIVPRIFLLSSTVDPEDYKRARKYSMVQDFISKPLNKEALDAIM